MKIKNEYGEAVAIDSSEGYYPSLTINEKAIPELKKKDVGDMCEIMIKAKIIGIRANSSNTFYELEVREGESYYDKEE